MLVLSRKQGEALKLTVDGREIVIYVNHLTDTRVKLAVEAERDVRVIRTELEEPVLG